MAIKTRYTTELIPRSAPAARAAETIRRMASDERLSGNAKQRTGNTKIEKWWSVVAGLLLVIIFILYSFYLTIPAVILLGVLVVFLIYIGISLRLQRKSKESAEHEISPRRSADAFIKKALGKEISGRDLTVYMSETDIAAFGAGLKSMIAEIAAAEGENAADISVATSAKVTEAEVNEDDFSIIPVEFTISIGTGTELLLKYAAPFAMASTGDCALADALPGFGNTEKTEIKVKG